MEILFGVLINWDTWGDKQQKNQILVFLNENKAKPEKQIKI